MRNATRPASTTLFMRLRLDEATRTRVIDSLRAMSERTQVQPGCCNLDVYVSAGDVVTMIEEWDSLGALEAHIRSPDFRAVLAAIDLSSQPPEIHVDQVVIRRGMNYLQEVLSSHE